MKVVIIDIDTLRTSRLGAYGCNRGTSPTIDHIAKEGVTYQRCYTSNSPCVPSRAAMISGRHGITNGIVTHPGSGAWLSPQSYFKDSSGLITRPLQKKGIKCASASSFYKHDHGVETGWFGYAFDHRLDPSPLRPCQRDSAEEVNAVALPWIRQHQKDDFLIHIHYWEPHTPYDLPKVKHEKFLKNPPWEYPTEAMKEEHVRKFYAQGAPRFGITNVKGLDDFMNTYDAQIYDADLHVSEVLKALDEYGILDETMIIITSDHGEQFGEQGIYGEHAAAVEPTIKVPLVIRFPHKKYAGTISEDLVYSQDIVPTIWELANAQPNPTDFQSLIPALEGKAIPRTHVICDHGLYTSTRAIVQQEWKLLLTYSPAYFGYDLYPPLSLFHLKTDPHEEKNLAEKNPEKVKELLGLLNHWLQTNGYSLEEDPMSNLGDKGPSNYQFPSSFIRQAMQKYR